MTAHQLIDELLKIEDKSKEVYFKLYWTDYNEDREYHSIKNIEVDKYGDVLIHPFSIDEGEMPI